MNLGEFRFIPIDAIIKNQRQHRSNYDEGKIKELSDSIVENGVLEPILVRPVDPDAIGPEAGEVFEIVAGQRRWMASKLAELSEMPCIVRELNDEEAFDISVIENLQRVDVHPLDEANAIAWMQKKGYSVSEIALRMGKSPSYVVHRVKISELIEPLKKAFFEEKFGISHAVEICRLTEHDQKSMYEKFYKSEPGWGGYPTVVSLKRHIENNYILDLSKSAFKTKLNDENLIEGVGACTNCLKRSGANPTLFGDVEAKDLCFDRVCFGLKNDAIFQMKLKEAKDRIDEVVFLTASYHNIDSSLVKSLAKEGYLVLESYDEFYERHNAKYSDENITRGFWISGPDKGKYTKVEVKKKKTSDGGSTEDPDTPEHQIAKITIRERRAEEIDREKVQKAMIDRLAEDDFVMESSLSKIDLLRYLAFALWQSGLRYEMDESLADAAKKYIDHQGSWAAKNMAITQLLFDEGEQWIESMLFSWFASNCTSSSELDYKKYAKAYGYRMYAKQVSLSIVDELDAQQDDIAQKRKKKVESKIKKLQTEE